MTIKRDDMYSITYDKPLYVSLFAIFLNDMLNKTLLKPSVKNLCINFCQNL